MHSRRRARPVLSLVMAFLFGIASQSCLSDIADEDGGTDESSGCEAWQDAFCDYDRNCDGLYDCNTEVRWVTCRSDSEAERCASALDSASCEDPPEDCGLEETIDADPARAACRTFIRELCEDSARCGQSPDACATDAEASLKCSSMDVVSPSYPDCFEDLQAQSCSAGELPSSCLNIFADLI